MYVGKSADVLNLIVPRVFGQVDSVPNQLPRKTSKLQVYSNPYRKPTQVVK